MEFHGQSRYHRAASPEGLIEDLPGAQCVLHDGERPQVAGGVVVWQGVVREARICRKLISACAIRSCSLLGS
jgi:hypothetical protein